MNNLRNNDLILAIGARIRQLREAKGWSMDQLCLECEMEKTQLFRIESGKNNSTISTLSVIAKALGVTISELLNGI
ncbi:MAG: helix-turn-helix domain-containing protein [Candidatus Pacearchaeota archaeon]